MLARPRVCFGEDSRAVSERRIDRMGYVLRAFDEPLRAPTARQRASSSPRTSGREARARGGRAAALVPHRDREDEDRSAEQNHSRENDPGQGRPPARRMVPAFPEGAAPNRSRQPRLSPVHFATSVSASEVSRVAGGCAGTSVGGAAHAAHWARVTFAPPSRPRSVPATDSASVLLCVEGRASVSWRSSSNTCRRSRASGRRS